jgi:hypothetical protein
MILLGNRVIPIVAGGGTAEDTRPIINRGPDAHTKFLFI